MDQVANRTRPPEERRTVPLSGSAGDSRGPCFRSVDAQPQAAAHVNPPAGAADTCRPGRLHPPWRIECGRRLAKNASQPCQGYSAHSHVPCHGRCRRHVSRPGAMAMATWATPVVVGVLGERGHGVAWAWPGRPRVHVATTSAQCSAHRAGSAERLQLALRSLWSPRYYRPHCRSCREAFSKGRRVRGRLSIPSLPRHRPYCPASTRTPAARRAGGRVLRLRGVRTGRSEGCLVPVAAARAVRLTPEASQPAATGATFPPATQRRRVT